MSYRGFAGLSLKDACTDSEPESEEDRNYDESSLGVESPEYSQIHPTPNTSYSRDHNSPELTDHRQLRQAVDEQAVEEVVKPFEVDDPLIHDGLLVNGNTEFRPYESLRTFQLDFSQFMEIIRSSYQTMIQSDQDFHKFVSLSMYTYYCEILLWKRILYILKERCFGVDVYERLARQLPPMAIPIEIGLYLEGIGNIKEPNGTLYWFTLQDVLMKAQYDGISGTFGRVDLMSHLSYETLPAPFVAIYRILMDVARTKGHNRKVPIDLPADWDLPSTLRPLILNVVPNRNLLGWDRCEYLTQQQMSLLKSVGLSAKPKVEDENDIGFEINTQGVTNIEGVPIVYQLLVEVSQLLYGADNYLNNYPEPISFHGSLGQVGYIIRSPILNRASGHALEPISQNEGTAVAYRRMSKYMCSAIIQFRYRVKRKVDGIYDSFCYTGHQGGCPNDEWNINEDDVFKSCPAWNHCEFSSKIHLSGLTASNEYVERIRRFMANVRDT